MRYGKLAEQGKELRGNRRGGPGDPGSFIEIRTIRTQTGALRSLIVNDP
jgi:hypothetical protein